MYTIEKIRPIAIVSSLIKPCGISQYGIDLAAALYEYYSVDVIESMDLARTHLETYSSFVLNWHPARLPVTRGQVSFLRNRSKDVIVIVHNTKGTQIPPDAEGVIEASSYSICHEPVEHRKVIYIPHGILEVPDLLEPTTTPSVGTGGFLFAWKRPDIVIGIAKKANCFANMVCPPYPDHIFPDELEAQWRPILGDQLMIHKQYEEAEQAVRLLSRSWVNVFYFESQGEDDQLGRSGAVRLGLAARRPIVLSRHRKFEDLFEYEDELYFCDTPEKAYKEVQGIFFDILSGKKVKVPNRILKDMGWSKAASKIRDVIEMAHKEKNIVVPEG